MKHFLPALFCCLTGLLSAQTIELGQDTTLCPGDSITIHATIDSSQFIILDNPTVLNLTDDWYSGLVNIGFSFTFYGNTYSQVAIGSNGAVSFNTGQANNYHSWAVTSLPVLSGATSVLNSILAPWTDLSGGPVSYNTIGTAPNRRFVVYYGAPVLSYPNCSGSAACWNAAVVLHETSNIVDIFIRNKPHCGPATQGLQNAFGTIAAGVPGRNGGVWSCQNDGKRFTPSGANYTIQDIPFQPVFDGPFSLVWSNTLGTSQPFTDLLTTDGNAGQSVGYFVSYSSSNICSGAVLPFSDTSWIYQTVQVPPLTLVHDFCSSGSGAIQSADPTTTDSSFTWTMPAVSSDTLTGLTAGTYDYLYTANNGCAYNGSVEITNNDSLGLDIHNASCLYSTNGWVVITPNHPALTFDWINPAGESGNTAYGLAPGNYSVYVQSPGDCSDTVDFTIGVNNDLQADTLITQDESCYGSADGSFTAVISGGTNPIFYELDNVSIPGPQSQGLASGTYVFEVTSGSCHYAEAFVINSPDALVLNVQTTVEILGNDGTATISVNGGTPGYVFLVNGEVQLNGYFDQLQAGTYTAYIADQNGCADSISFTIQSVVGLTEGKASALNVFPNPANDQLAIQGIEGTYELIVEDLFGKHCLVLQGENDAPVSVAGLPAGIYQLTICQNGQSYSGMKLVKR